MPAPKHTIAYNDSNHHSINMIMITMIVVINTNNNDSSNNVIIIIIGGAQGRTPAHIAIRQRARAISRHAGGALVSPRRAGSAYVDV